MMIDTIRVVIPVDWGFPLYGGQTIVTKFLEGEEIRDYSVLKHACFEGSYSSIIHLRCIDGCNLELYGSVTKWISGHNLYGSIDLFSILRRGVDHLYYGSLAEYPRISDDQIRSAKIQRIDINEMFELNSAEDVKLYLAIAAARTSLSHRGKGALAENGCTLAWGMQKGNRSAWKVKFYAKGPEARVVRKGKSSLPGQLLADPATMVWVDRQLRLELELHGRELDKLGARYVRDWKPETAMDVWSGKVGLFFWGDEPVSIERNADIPRRVRNAYAAWLRGDDMTTDCSRSTYYRMRGEVKRFFGCDIALPSPAQKPSNVVVFPVKRVLELKVADPGEIANRVERLLR
ncbi:phage/plasmid replication protein, II/X family [Sphingomonas sp.]|uniref:phage/plasmid replication protein, II/X family n=1 Tax=Sphingomonas sp. TaxID=28214 RepID=UPI003D6DA81E